MPLKDNRTFQAGPNEASAFFGGELLPRDALLLQFGHRSMLANIDSCADLQHHRFQLGRAAAAYMQRVNDTTIHDTISGSLRLLLPRKQVTSPRGSVLGEHTATRGTNLRNWSTACSAIEKMPIVHG